MERKFKPGDKVQLISGGPIMTVEGYETGSANERKVKCVWFDEKNKPQEKTFAEELLKPYQRPKATGLRF